MSWYADLPHDHAGGDGGPRSLTQCVVIHATDNTASASGEAHYAETRSDQTSAHFYVDEGVVIQALDTDNIAFGCFPIGNGRSIQFELCGLSNHLTDATLRKAAPIVARVCNQYGIPIRHVGAADLVAGTKGICGHGDVTNAWHQGDHTDPGASFPWDTFIRYVQAAGGSTMLDEDFAPYGRPSKGGGRNIGTLAADVWGQEVLGGSPYDGAKSVRTAQLQRIEDALAEVNTKLDHLATGGVDVATIAAAVANELGKRLKAAP